MMGGTVCQVERNAVLEFASVPTDPALLPKFDKQLRKAFTLGEIATAITAAGTGPQVCAILWKFDGWTLTDRTQLLDYLEALW
jgi:hypothetical protein